MIGVDNQPGNEMDLDRKKIRKNKKQQIKADKRKKNAQIIKELIKILDDTPVNGIEKAAKISKIYTGLISLKSQLNEKLQKNINGITTKINNYNNENPVFEINLNKANIPTPPPQITTTKTT